MVNVYSHETLVDIMHRMQQHFIYLPRNTLVAVVFLLILPLSPTSWAMDTDSARHLLVRTGFEARITHIQALHKLSHKQAVKRILYRTHSSNLHPAPVWVQQPLPDFRRIRQMGTEARKALARKFRKQSFELKGWWYQQMIQTDAPLRERMTLFWHNHFTSGFRKVRVPQLMYRQNMLLRKHALGNFGQLLHAISKDPAMIIYLDNQSNHKRKPNENFSRELLELYTLGEGHYTEQDIKEASRAFTGWMVNPRNGQYWFNVRRHDFGHKTFLSKSGDLDGKDIVDILLKHPRTAELITEKAWREFISSTPNRREVKRISSKFRASGYEIKVLLYELLTSPFFTDKQNRGSLIKSPVELIVGTLRQFRIRLKKDHYRLARVGRYLGQDIMDPPNVKGWPGGTAWITSGTLLARKQLLLRLLRGRMPGGRKMSPKKRRMATPEKEFDLMPVNTNLARQQILTRLLLPIKPVNPVPKQLGDRALIRHLLLDPAYQLK